MEKTNKFRLYVPLTKSNNSEKNYKKNDNGTLDIAGRASTINKDLQKDIVLPSAIKSMKKQLLTSNKNLHGDHRYGLFDGLLGSINKVLESDDTALDIGATILSKYADDIQEMLDIGVQLGLSIGGNPTEYDINKDGGWAIKNIDLYEISLTAMPANMDTLGTVTTTKNGVVEGTCLSGICHKLIKNMKPEEEEVIPMNRNEQNIDSDNFDTKIKAAVDELWAEKEQGLVDSITEVVSTNVKNIVQEELKKAGNSQNNEPQGEVNPEEDEINKGLTNEEMGKIIQKEMETQFGEFKKQFFKNLEEERNPQSNVDLNQQEQILEKNNQNNNTNTIKTYSTVDTAKMLMEKQRGANPILNAVINNI